VLTAASAGQIRTATTDDAPRLADALARAFQDDPGWSHLLPHAGDRTRRLRYFFEVELREVIFPHGVIWTTDEVAGAAVWMPPDGWRVPVRASVRETPSMVRVFGRRLPLALRARMRIESKHPRRPPHWYLAIMGVAPEWQGRGLGSKLMYPKLQELDTGEAPAYLESSTPRSRALYQRHGFEVVGELNLPSDGPPLWRMWREPSS
jgi:ribosomal protein S18 acetylase RimI-like enzyme